MKRFAVIAVDYEHHVPRSHNALESYEFHTYHSNSTSIHRGLKSLADQTFKDFNLIICHDGPKDVEYMDEGIDLNAMGLSGMIINTPIRNKNWGHSSRDYAMKNAYENNLGEYYIQFNIDNEFFPNAFEEINRAIEENDEKVFTFPVHHWKAMGGEVLLGTRPEVGYIDAMQLVAHRDVWKDINFWHNDHQISDGILYEEICSKNKWRHIPACMGHNF